MQERDFTAVGGAVLNTGAKWQVFDNEADWRERRRSFLTASDLAVICGGGYKSQFALYHDKIGGFEDQDENKEELFWFGHRMEEVTSDRFAVLHPGYRVYCLLTQWTMCYNPEFPLFAATPDRILQYPDGTFGILELKNRSAYAPSWDEEVPEDVLVQHQIQMFCARMDKGFMAAVIGGNRFKYAERTLYQPFIESMKVAGQQWWDDHIVAGVPPRPDGSDSTKRTLKLLHPSDNGETVALSPECVDLDAEREAVCEQLKALENRKAEIDNLIKAHIGDATFGQIPGVQYSLKTQESTPAIKIKNPPLDLVMFLRDQGISFDETGGEPYRVLRRRQMKG